jgi:hypothetical protein
MHASLHAMQLQQLARPLSKQLHVRYSSNLLCVLLCLISCCVVLALLIKQRPTRGRWCDQQVLLLAVCATAGRTIAGDALCMRSSTCKCEPDTWLQGSIVFAPQQTVFLLARTDCVACITGDHGYLGVYMNTMLL